MAWLASRQKVAVVVAVLLAAGMVVAAAAAKARGRGPVPPEFSGTVYLPNGQPATNATLQGTGTAYSFVEPRSKSGVPLSGGGLTGMSGRPLEKIVTDAQGRYRMRFPIDQPGEADVRERVATTYSMLVYSPEGLGYAAVGQLGENGVMPDAPLDIHLQEGDRVAGRVVGYPEGQALAGVAVSAEVSVGSFRGRPWPIQEVAVTDREGRFRLRSSLPPNGYSLEARPAGWAMMETKTEPPPSKAPAARTVEIRLARPYTIRGHAYGPDGRPLRKTYIGFSVEGFAPAEPGVRGSSFGSGGETTTDDAGAFALPQEGRIFPYGQGPYLFHYLALAPKLDGGAVARPVVVDATDPATQTVDLHFVAPATVTGRGIDAASGQPAVGVRARLVPVWPGLSPREWDKLREGIFDEARSVVKDDQTGGFVLRGVPPGEYRLQLEGWTIPGRTVENEEAIPVTVGPGQTADVGTVQVVYVPHFRGRLSGLPWNPAPEGEEVRGVLRPSGGESPGQEGYVDLWAGGGKYTLWATGRPAGRYDAVLIAWKGSARYVTPVLRGLELQEDVPLEGINLRFTRGASIGGKVVQADGKPLPKTAVTVRGAGGDAVMFGADDIYGIGQQMLIQLDTNLKGEFAVQGLLPGEYEVIAHPEPVFFGPRPTARVRVGATEQKRGVVLRTKRNG